MKITESRLREVIQDVILKSDSIDLNENLNLGNYPESPEEGVRMMKMAFNDLLELSRSHLFDKFCEEMKSQMGYEGAQFCKSLREVARRIDVRKLN